MLTRCTYTPFPAGRKHFYRKSLIWFSNAPKRLRVPSAAAGHSLLQRLLCYTAAVQLHMCCAMHLYVAVLLPLKHPSLWGPQCSEAAAPLLALPLTHPLLCDTEVKHAGITPLIISQLISVTTVWQTAACGYRKSIRAQNERRKCIRKAKELVRGERRA